MLGLVFFAYRDHFIRVLNEKELEQKSPEPYIKTGFLKKMEIIF